ncbi:MAG: hypothetical protein KBA46_03515 [Candidatus Omnitrophica bacterium]|nr:hypothetical protein [Candidatus Omnitrophota bacterium]
MKKLALSILCFVWLHGCTYCTPGIGFQIWNKRYAEFIGKRYETVAPLQIMQQTGDAGGYWLVPYSWKETSSLRLVAPVPVGSIIMVDHVSRSDDAPSDKEYHYIGKFITPHIFGSGFELWALMDWDQELGPFAPEEQFKQKFAGMKQEYLKSVIREAKKKKPVIEKTKQSQPMVELNKLQQENKKN